MRVPGLDWFEIDELFVCRGGRGEEEGRGEASGD